MTIATDVARHRVFLFLQGPSSPIFTKIAVHLEAAGHECLRINLNVGDWLFWRRAGALNYRGDVAGWPSYIEEIMLSCNVTDLVLLGEERPYHRVAVDKAKQRGIDVTVVEMGYLRPDWVTVERDGMSSNSRFPPDPDTIREAARGLPKLSLEPIYRQSFLKEAFFDLAYNLPNVFLSPLFPGYRRHGIFHPLREYAGWCVRLLKSRRNKEAANHVVDRLHRSKQRYFIYPLQLETDYQLRAHSPYQSQMEAIEEVISSFATASSPETVLVVKLHPLDNGLTDWRDKIKSLSRRLGVNDRVLFIDGGDLAKLVAECSGMVTVNSTAVLAGLRKGVPAKILGCAIYDVEGLTHQGSLDSFWWTPHLPQPALADDFFSLMAAAIHVRGNFYSRAGSKAAAQAISNRLLSGKINSHGADTGVAKRTKPVKKGLPA